jgi:phytanoyl-CoA hydroxylase
VQTAIHPRNRAFEWQATTGPYRRITTEQARAYDELGFFVIEDAFDDAEIEAVVAEIDPVEERVEGFLRQQPDGKMFIARAGEITFAPNLVKQNQRLRAFVSNQVFQDLTHDLIGPDVRLYWDQAVYKKPDTLSPFPWHQDNGYTYTEPQQYLTCWVALTDATIENGCPWVIPAKHRDGTLAHQMSDLGWVCVDDPGDHAVAAPVRKGGIVVFSSLTPHATGPNTTSGVRKSYIVQFAPDGAVAYPRGNEDLDAVAEPCDAETYQFRVLTGGRAP